VVGDLLEQDVDVIVNAWNRNIIPWWLLLPQGVSGAIKRHGGTGPFKELAKHGSIPLGGAVLTSAGRLPFKGIIHVAGINMLWRASERSIRDSVRNAMALAHKKGFQSIAFPLIGAGRAGSTRSGLGLRWKTNCKTWNPRWRLRSSCSGVDVSKGAAAYLGGRGSDRQRTTGCQLKD
jgi:O-acetyl-ADP-ribose deacetylase (regulator of RNase III)